MLNFFGAVWDSGDFMHILVGILNVDFIFVVTEGLISRQKKFSDSEFIGKCFLFSKTVS